MTRVQRTATSPARVRRTGLRAGIAALLRSPAWPAVLAAFILLAPAWATGRALYWGTPVMQFVPWRMLAWQSLQAGHLPLWNPLNGMGAPLLANYQTAFLYPPNWLYFLLAAIGGAPALAWGQALLVAAHLALAGAGMARLVRRLGLGCLAQTVAGLAFGLSGYLVARAGFLSINAAAAWLPWVLLCLTPDQALTDPGWATTVGDRSAGIWRWAPLSLSRWLGLVLALSMLLLAGHAQTAWYTLLLAAAWAAFWGWQAGAAQVGVGAGRWRSPAQGVLRYGLVLGVALLAAVALSLAQLLPTAEYLLQSQRSAAVDHELAMAYSFWPWHVLSLFAPDLFGNPVQGDYWGFANYWEDAIYIGMLPILMALAALFRRKPGPSIQRSLKRFTVAVLVITFLLALGNNTPLFPWLYRNVPTFSMFQAPARYLIWAEFVLALLAALGVAGWRRPQGRGLYWARLGTMGAFAVTVGAGLTWMLMGDVNASFVRGAALAGFWALGCAFLNLLAPKRGAAQDQARGVRLWSAAVVAWVALDLLVTGWGLNPVLDRSLYAGRSPTAETVRQLGQGGRLYLAQEDERRLKFERFFVFDSFHPEGGWDELRAVILPNLNLLDGLDSANNFDPLIPGRYARWWAQLQTLEGESQERILNLMAVSVVEKMQVHDPFGVFFEARETAPRARWVPCSHPAADAEQAWQLVMDGQVDLASSVVLEAADTQDCRPQASGQVRWLMPDGPENPGRMVLQTQAQADGWLVLADAWYPGWQAQVDGRAVPVYRANYLFRAVAVPAGEHRVVLTYRPLAFWAGVIASLLAAVGLLFISRKPLRAWLHQVGR